MLCAYGVKCQYHHVNFLFNELLYKIRITGTVIFHRCLNHSHTDIQYKSILAYVILLKFVEQIPGILWMLVYVSGLFFAQAVEFKNH